MGSRSWLPRAKASRDWCNHWDQASRERSQVGPSLCWKPSAQSIQPLASTTCSVWVLPIPHRPHPRLWSFSSSLLTTPTPHLDSFIQQDLRGSKLWLCGGMSPLAAFPRWQSTTRPVPGETSDALTSQQRTLNVPVSFWWIATIYLHLCQYPHTNLSYEKDSANSLGRTSKWTQFLGIQKQPLASL